MIIKVCLGDAHRGVSDIGERNSEIPSEVLINPDCPVRVISNFLRSVFRLDNKCEVDLCDSEGNLLFLYEKEPWATGLNYLKLKSTYFVVLICKDKDGYSIKPMGRTSSSNTREEEMLWSDIMVRIKKQLKGNKSSRIMKIRSGSTVK